MAPSFPSLDITYSGLVDAEHGCHILPLYAIANKRFDLLNVAFRELCAKIISPFRGVREMGPRSALDDVGDAGVRDAEPAGNVSPLFAAGIEPSDFDNVGIGKDGTGIRLSEIRRMISSALSLLVKHVVSVRSKKEVLRVDAPRVIALVENMNSGRYPANMEFVGYSVSGGLVFPVTRVNHPVTFIIFGCGPNPATAFVVLVFLVESVNQRFHKVSDVFVVTHYSTVREGG